MDLARAKQSCCSLRNSILDMIHGAGSGHCGGSLSCVEILWTLYSHILRVREDSPLWEGRDRFLLSKGHAAPALYAVLAERGFFDPAVLKTLRMVGSMLQGHPDMRKTPGVEMSTGSLGMGISVGVGMALGARLAEKRFRVYVLVGDGELQEGQNWEALAAASRYCLGNLTVIVDRNGVQLDGPVDQIMPLGDLEGKLELFGWSVRSCDGHDCRALADALQPSGTPNGKPSAVVAYTIKGKGVSFMEGQSAWHGKPLLEDDYRRARAELAVAASLGGAT